MSLVEIETEWSINDLADAHEMVSWKNAGILEEQRVRELNAKAVQR